MGVAKRFIFFWLLLSISVCGMVGKYINEGVILERKNGLSKYYELYVTEYKNSDGYDEYVNWDFCIDGKGNIYIGEGYLQSSYFPPRLHKFSSKGNLVYTEDLLVPASGEQASPVLMVADKAGNFYVFLGYNNAKEDTKHDIIFKFNSKGEPVRSFFDINKLEKPQGIYDIWFDKAGRVIFYNYDYVFFYDTAGTFIKKHKKITKDPAANGEYFFDLTERGIEIFDSKGAMVKIVRPERIYALPRFIDENNNMYGVYNKKSETGNLKIVTVHDHNGNSIAEFDITGPENRIIKKDGTLGDSVSVHAEKLKLDPYGNIFFRADSKDKAFFLKFAKTHYIPATVSQMPAKKTPQGVYNVSEYTYVPSGKIKESGFIVLKGGKEISKYETNKDLPLTTVKYLGKDNSGRQWFYYEMPRTKKEGKKYTINDNKRDWTIISKQRKRFSRENYWRPAFSSRYKSIKNNPIPGIITEDNIDFEKVKISTDGDLCYKSGENWYKQKYIQDMQFEKTSAKDFIKPDKNITVKSFAEYEDIDPVECERGIEIKKENQSIRKFKYYYQDTLYTVQNLGLDDKNNIYIYVNWFDWLTKDKMKEVVKFNTKGEFQNRIRIENAETPVLGQDGSVYTYEKGEKGIVRKYGPKTLPE